MAPARRPLVALLSSTLTLGACEPHRSDPLSAPSVSEPSPNASVLPAPLAAGPTRVSARDAGHLNTELAADAGILLPPRPIREDEALAPDTELRAAPGVALEARFRWVDAPMQRLPESSVDAIARARERVAFAMAIELSSVGRLRLSFASKTFPFPPATDLRARDDRYGHLLVWPNREAYTPLAPGTLRAALAEVRVDVVPLADPAVTAAGASTMLGLPTQKQRLETSIGKLELEQANVVAAGSGAALWCRLLLELVAVSAESPACRAEWLPLHAEYSWASGGRFELEVTKLTKRAELGPEGLTVPPNGAEARRGELPGPASVALLDDRELAELRLRPLPGVEKPEASAPKQGLAFQNRSDVPRYLVVDGVPVVWLRPGAEWLVSGLKTGRYSIQARDFFGSESKPTKTLDLPARFLVGEEPDRTAH